MRGLTVARFLGTEYELIDIRPSFTVSTMPIASGLCRRTKLKNLLVLPALCRCILPSRFRPWIFCFIY